MEADIFLLCLRTLNLLQIEQLIHLLTRPGSVLALPSLKDVFAQILSDNSCRRIEINNKICIFTTTFPSSY
jgi:hypothetical protein